MQAQGGREGRKEGGRDGCVCILVEDGKKGSSDGHKGKRREGVGERRKFFESREGGRVRRRYMCMCVVKH
jgi:hypothetical protein